MTGTGQCVVCGLDTHGRGDRDVELCGPTCVREAEQELRVLVGELHRIERLRQWRESADAWRLVLHPVRRRDADAAIHAHPERDARRAQLDGALRAWARAYPPARAVDPLGPRPVAGAVMDASQ